MAATAQAVQFGWQRLADGGIEYLVQVEPELLESFHQDGFTSDLPSGLRDVRKVRIVVGREILPNQGDTTGPIASVEPRRSADVGAPAEKTMSSTDITANAQSPQGAVSNGTASGGWGFATDPSPKAESAHPFPALPLFERDRNRMTNQDPRMAVSQPDNAVEVRDSRPLAGANRASPTDWNLPTSTPTMVDANKPDTTASPEAVGRGTLSESKPWLPLMAALLGLFASLGANVYLVWIYQAVRIRYRSLLEGTRGPAAAI